ncbi:uncharacterized protein PGTG_18469 [Puccinia graminis f. sp. tritici CRL 75-36-700-3]|uniref:Rad60/SUMO-like domain-containing protein n=1 Tax=Puccinia graminis f. sp. tritici (strain CRL 75-36-700-3 / race SCCL) TaxID=418459 RepID=E3L6S9_PUCGT|nr:uncharacterized protein PGTG_18469 [Puccinia graminis f. sp. tritici CRL 75-36-700-3]EFP92254.2 hypothetical protein PGTG_18469 [Puccinia graminis f. sp. tritici CRL 75-36-700-3]
MSNSPSQPGPDPDGDEPLILRVKTTTAFQKIFNAVAAQKNAALGSFRLQYDGQNLLPNETTPADLNFDDEEVLDYFVQAIGG